MEWDDKYITLASLVTQARPEVEPAQGKVWPWISDRHMGPDEEDVVTRT